LFSRAWPPLFPFWFLVDRFPLLVSGFSFFLTGDQQPVTCNGVFSTFIYILETPGRQGKETACPAPVFEERTQPEKNPEEKGASPTTTKTGDGQQKDWVNALCTQRIAARNPGARAARPYSGQR
jgi:hypothetical protein